MLNIHSRQALVNIILDYLSVINFYSPPEGLGSAIGDLFLEDVQHIMSLVLNKQDIKAIKYLRELPLTNQNHNGVFHISLDTPKPDPIGPDRFTIEEYIQSRWNLDSDINGKGMMTFHSNPQVKKLPLWQAKAIIDFLAKIPEECWDSLPEKPQKA